MSPLRWFYQGDEITPEVTDIHRLTVEPVRWPSDEELAALQPGRVLRAIGRFIIDPIARLTGRYWYWYTTEDGRRRFWFGRLDI